jgi:quercetin dioxygenase-like cupin family protein
MERKILIELIEHEVSVRTDNRGSVMDLRHFASGRLNGLHIAEMKPGAVRGNHVHDKDEIISVIGGAGICEIRVEDTISMQKESLIVDKDMVVYRIKAGINHTVVNKGKSSFYIVCFYIK